MSLLGFEMNTSRALDKNKTRKQITEAVFVA